MNTKGSSDKDGGHETSQSHAPSASGRLRAADGGKTGRNGGAGVDSKPHPGAGRRGVFPTGYEQVGATSIRELVLFSTAFVDMVPRLRILEC